MTLYSTPRIDDEPDLKRLCARAMSAAREIFGGEKAARTEVRAILDESLFTEIGDLFAQEALTLDELSRADELLMRSERDAAGVFFTPAGLADKMCSLVGGANVGRVCDPSCGSAELLLAAHRAFGARVVGVEINPFLALAAAIRLAHVGADAEIIWADALGEPLEEVDLVISNPPYVGEKGRKALFDSVRAAHPELESRFAARMDLAYLFMHHAMDISERTILLTSEYWLTADSAFGLRERLVSHQPIYCHRLGRGVFESARGHHSLVTTLGFEPSDVFEARGRVDATDGASWFPFASNSLSDYESLPKLEELARDQQGFVSGLDRATGRHLELEKGAPFFIARSDELEDRDLSGGGWWRPILRARDCRRNAVFVDPPSNEYVLWLDDVVELEEPMERLKLARDRLSKRREVEKGSMPWYRLHWPRKRSDQIAPKLVVPRRAREATFCLDLSASHVSSDCTYILAEGHQDPISYLVRLMLSLNSEETAAYLDEFAKRKGEIIEFYSTPLKRVPVFVEERAGQWRLIDDRLERQAAGILANLGL